MDTKITLKVSGMHCTSCALNIDGELEDTEGVLEASTNYAKQQTSITFDVEKISLDRIKEIVKKVGYETEVVQ